MQTIQFLLSADAADQRMVARKPTVVVHVEVEAGRFIELDADDLAHGHRLAQMWVDPAQMGKMSSAVRPVRTDGTLGRIDGRIYCHATMEA